MKKTFATTLIAGAFLIQSLTAFAQPSLNDTQDIAAFTTIVESHSDALFVRALADECSHRYPERATAWSKTRDAYLAHFSSTAALIQAQYAKTLGIAISKADYDAKAAKILLRQTSQGAIDWNGLCSIATKRDGLAKLIENYPLDRSEKSIDALYKASENGSVDRLAAKFQQMSGREREVFAKSFLAKMGQ